MKIEKYKFGISQILTAITLSLFPSIDLAQLICVMIIGICSCHSLISTKRRGDRALPPFVVGFNQVMLYFSYFWLTLCIAILIFIQFTTVQ